jgi:MFS family permease
MRAKILGSRSYSWLVVLLLWLVCLINYADRQAIFSVFSLVKTDLGLTDVQLGVLGSCFMWVYALSGPVAGWITDRVSRAGVIVCALIFWSMMTGATMWAHSYGALLALRGLAGLGEAFYFPAAMSLIASYHGARTRSRAMSFHQSSVYVGTIVGGSVAAYVAQRSGWRTSFGAFGAAGLVLAAVLLLLLRDPAMPLVTEDTLEPQERSGGRLWDDLVALMRNRPVLVSVGVFMGANFVAVVFLAWAPTFLQRKFSMGLGVAAFNGTAYLQTASVAGVIAGGFLADGFRRRWLGGRQLVQAFGFLGGVGFLFATGVSSSVRVVLASMAGFGFFKGLYDANIWASLYDFVKLERRGLATGLMNSLGWLGGGFAPIVVALLASRYSLGACISLTAGMYGVLGITMWWLFRRQPLEAPETGGQRETVAE